MDPTRNGTAYVSFLKTEAPPIENVNGKNILNLGLTLPETLLTIYLDDHIKTQVRQKNYLGCFETCSAMQKDFTNFVTKKFSINNFTDKQLVVPNLIRSIWEKSKVFVINELKEYKVQDEVDYESNWQTVAAFIADKKNLPQVFTLRQIAALSWFNEVAITSFLAQSHARHHNHHATNKNEDDKIS